MGAIKNILQKQVQQSEMDRIYSCSGEILDYDHRTGLCTVAFVHPASEEKIVSYKVPVANTGTIVSANSIKSGMTCELSFQNGYVTTPTVVSVLESNYNDRCNKNTGAFFTDAEIHTVDKPISISPMSNDWIDQNNTDADKYNEHYLDYKEVDLISYVSDIMSYTDHLSPNESGIITPDGSIRTKDTGEIDLFAGFNTGLKICTDGSLRFYGNNIMNMNDLTCHIYFNDTPLEEIIKRIVQELLNGRI